MPSESQIDLIAQVYGDLVRLGGQSERTGILTNVIVIDAAPAGLTGRVIIRDPRDGDYIPALTVPGVVYANNDLVNVLFVEGTEPIAYQQGSQSSGSNVKVFQIWESDFGAVAWSTNATGDISAAGAYDITTTGDLFVANIQATGNITLPNATAIIGSGSSNPDLGASASANRWGSIFLASSEIINALNSYDLTVGSIGSDITMVRLTDAAQDVLDLGDVAGTGDVDIDFSNGQMFLRGSDGILGLGTTSPSVGPSAIFGMHIKESSANCGLFVDAGSGQTAVYYMGHAGSANWQFQSGSGNDFQIVETGVAVRFTILDSDNGKTMVGTGTPTAQLHVDQSSTTAAIPVLYLDQADISEEMIEFNTTIGVGNAIEAAGAKTLTTTHFIKVTLPGALTRYIPCGTIA